MTYAAGVDVELTEFEKSTWSFIASGASLSALYFVYVAWMAVATGRFALVRPIDLGWVDLVAVYPLLLVVSVVVGYVSAKAYARTLGTPPTPHAETAR